MDQSITFQNVAHIYNQDSPFEHRALEDVSFTIPLHQVTAIIGHTGSGKSTILQHLNVLLRPTSGTVNIFDHVVTHDSEHGPLKHIRKRVGVVFQFPEAQLFEETVLKDVMFGPMNFGASEEEAEKIAREKLEDVGIDSALFERSPFELSGGQMRRVAIAGVLALEPEVLVLDEPTAGLDPAGHQAMMEMFMRLKESQNLTIVLVSHQMNDVARYSDHVIVLEKGKVVKVGSTESVFSDAQWLSDKQLSLPTATAVVDQIGDERLTQPSLPLTVESLADRLSSYLPQREGGQSNV